MKPVHLRRLLLTLSLMVAAASDRTMVQPADQRRGPLPQGSLIGARDGDTVLIDEDARVRVIRRRRAYVRVVFDATQRWVILLARYQSQNGITTGGIEGYTFRDVEGDWTLGNRWEGDSTIEVYSLAGQPGASTGVGFRTSEGTVQLLAREQQQFKDPTAALVLVYRGSSRSMAASGSFDEIERLKVDEASGVRPPPVTARGTAGVADAPVRLPSGGFPPGPPRKVRDVRPVWPDEARRAGVQGIVVVEFTVDVDGTPADARILRGIPLLDKAALDCVRQWRYEPMLLNGQPIPFRMTAAVTFP
jgi:TonB family protein